MSSNKLVVNSAHVIVGIAIATLIGCVQFEHSFDEPRGPKVRQTVNSSSAQGSTESHDSSADRTALSEIVMACPVFCTS
jgi:hypothetical protein